MATIYNPQIVTNGLVLCLDAANPKSYSGSGVTWGDIGTNNNSFSLVNGPVYSTQNNGYFTFDGINDYALSSASVGNPSTFPNLTHIIWFYPTSAGQIVVELGQQAINTSWHDSNIEIDSSGVVRFSTWHGSLTNRVTSTAQSFNKWYQFAMTYSATSTKCEGYINGLSVGTTFFPRSYSSTNSVFYALCATDSTNMSSAAYAGGRVGMYAFYNRELTNTEIQNNFNAFRGRFGL